MVFDALVAGGVDVNEKDERGGTCLHIACREGMVQAGPASQALRLLLSHLATPKLKILVRAGRDGPKATRGWRGHERSRCGWADGAAHRRAGAPLLG